MKRIKKFWILLAVVVSVGLFTGCDAKLNRAVPDSAAAGSIITLRGAFFGEQPGEAAVYFGDEEAVITLWGKRSIKVKVPEGSGSCEIFVEKDGKLTKGANFTYLEEEYEVITTQDLVMSDSIQNVSAENMDITIPPQALNSSGKLKVSNVKNSPLPDDEMYLQTEVYSVEIDNATRFNDLLMLEFKVDDNLKESPYITAAYWDENAKEWVQAPSYRDEVKGTVRVYTDHLTNWRLLALKNIYDIHETDHFIIAYNEKDKTEIPDLQKKDAAAMAKRIGSALDEAYLKYYNEIGETNSPIYTVTEIKYIAATLNPSSWFSDNTEVTDTRLLVRMSSSYNAYGAEYSWSTKKLIIPTKYKDDKDLRSTAAHELFHAFQNHKLSVFQMGKARWLMEATAEYASLSVGMDYGIDKLHTYTKMDKNLEYFENREEGHEYGMSAYVDYIVGKGGDFGDMWNSIVAGSSDPSAAFNSYVESVTGEENRTNYRLFWQDVLTNSERPKFSITDIGVRSKPVAKGGTLKTGLNIRNSLAMAGLMTQPKEYNSDGSRTLIVEVDGKLPSGTWLEGFLVNNFDKSAFSHDRVPGGKSREGMLSDSDGYFAVDFTQSMNQMMYITAYGSENGILNIKVSDISLKLSPEEIEDAEPYKQYKFKAVAGNIPEVIENVTVSWELDDGTFISSEEYPNKRGRIADKTVHEFAEGELQDVIVTFEDSKNGRKLTSGRVKISDTEVLNIDYMPMNPMAGEEVEISTRKESAWYYKWDLGAGSSDQGLGMAEVKFTYGDAGRYQVKVTAYEDPTMKVSKGFGTTVITVEAGEAQSQTPPPSQQPTATPGDNSPRLIFDKDYYLPYEQLHVTIENSSQANYFTWTVKPADEQTMKAYKEATGQEYVVKDKTGSPGNMVAMVPGTYLVRGVHRQDESIIVEGSYVVKLGTEGYWERIEYEYPEPRQFDDTSKENVGNRSADVRVYGEYDKLKYDISSIWSYSDGEVEKSTHHMEWSDLPERLYPGDVVDFNYRCSFESNDEDVINSRTGLAVFYNERGSLAGIRSETTQTDRNSADSAVTVKLEVPAYGFYGNATRKLHLMSGVGINTEDDAMMVPDNYFNKVFAAYRYVENGKTY